MAVEASVTDVSDDAPGLTAQQLAEMRPARDVLTPEQFAAVTGRSGPKTKKPKVSVTIRLDASTVDAFKATGAGWQTRMNEALAAAAVRLGPTEPNPENPKDKPAKKKRVRSYLSRRTKRIRFKWIGKQRRAAQR